MGRYVEIDKRASLDTNGAKFRRFIERTFNGELFTGLWVVLRNMLKKDASHTLLYPREKFSLNHRYRGVHKLMRLLESGNERCIGCGLCEKICVSKCIAMETYPGTDGRKKVANYSINLGRCVYCGLCADVCPEIAIVHGGEYELASEQRAYYGFKEDLLIRGDNLCITGANQEFEGYGSLGADAGMRVKTTATAYLEGQDSLNLTQKNSASGNGASSTAANSTAASQNSTAIKPNSTAASQNFISQNQASKTTAKADKASNLAENSNSNSRAINLTEDFALNATAENSKAEKNADAKTDPVIQNSNISADDLSVTVQNSDTIVNSAKQSSTPNSKKQNLTSNLNEQNLTPNLSDEETK